MIQKRGKWHRLKKARGRRLHIDYLLTAVTEKNSLHERVLWLAEILRWIRVPHQISSSSINFQSGAGQIARLRYLFQILDRNPQWKKDTSAVIRSIIKEMDAVDLFSTVGIPHSNGFLYELAEIISYKFLPYPHRTNDLGEIFYLIFPTPEDALWMIKLDDSLLAQIHDLLQFNSGTDSLFWKKIIDDIKDALVYLSIQIQAQTLNPQFRHRLPNSKVRESPFYYLEVYVKDFLGSLTAPNSTPKFVKEQYQELIDLLQQCRQEIDYVHSNLDRQGVSFNLVFFIERIHQQIIRLKILADMLMVGRFKRERHLKFFIDLIQESSNRHSISAFVDDSLHLLALRITEKNSEAGEVYITRNWQEYRKIIKKAAGGGVITTFTASFKVVTELAVSSYFWSGMFSAINYSISFLMIQWCHFTLATKQPAMTATAISAKIPTSSDSKEQGDAFVDEIFNLVRSQFASTVGNILSVVPCVGLLVLAYKYFTGESPISAEFAHSILDDHSVLGPTPIYAAFTGFLLWLSSICAGIVDNWAAYRQISEGIAQQRTIVLALGKDYAQKIAQSFQKNIAGIAGNISLGFLLGLAPKVVSFFSIPCDVRHVTLSTGIVAFAAFSLGGSILKTDVLWLAVAGIGAAGIMNISVSFGLALWVAVSSRRTVTMRRRTLYKKLITHFLKKPWLVLIPKG